jgi:hypothetical protein
LGQDGEAVHFPEEQLTTYLRVFNPEERIDALLDEVAQAAIDSDVQDPVELYSLAHWLMEPDERRTDELEAVVLVEEVGLDVGEVAIVLDIDRAMVQAAVARAWAEVATNYPRSDPEGAAVAVEEQVAVPVQAAPVDRAAGERARQVGTRRRDEVEGSAPAAEPPTRRSVGLPDRAVLLPAVLAIALVVLAVAAFSDAGQQRLAAQGLNPFATIGALVLLFGVGGLLVVLGRDDR